MTLQSDNIVRTKVDSIRMEAQSQQAVLEQIESDPEGFLRSRGLLDEQLSKATSDMASSAHNSGSVHACPWQTCQATRISLD